METSAFDTWLPKPSLLQLRGLPWPAQLPRHPATPHPCFTQAAAALAIWLQHPTLVAGALHAELVLVTLLTALEVLGTVALDLTGVVVRPQLHAQGARTHNAFPGCHRAVVAAAAIIQRALVWETRSGGTGSGSGFWRKQEHCPAGPQLRGSPDRALVPCLWCSPFPFLANPLSHCFLGFLRSWARTHAPTTGTTLPLSLSTPWLHLSGLYFPTPFLAHGGDRSFLPLSQRFGNPFPFPRSLLLCGGVW